MRALSSLIGGYHILYSSPDAQGNDMCTRASVYQRLSEYHTQRLMGRRIDLPQDGGVSRGDSALETSDHDLEDTLGPRGSFGALLDHQRDAMDQAQ